MSKIKIDDVVIVRKNLYGGEDFDHMIGKVGVVKEIDCKYKFPVTVLFDDDILFYTEEELKCVKTLKAVFDDNDALDFTETKEANILSVEVDLNIDEAMQKLEDMKSLMLEINNIDISADKTSIKNKKMQDIEELLKDVDGIEIGSKSIKLNGDGYKPLSKSEYIDYMIETRRKSLEERWLKICKGCDYIFLGNDECLGEMFYSLPYIKSKSKDSNVSFLEDM